jgi:hypothetical protein
MPGLPNCSDTTQLQKQRVRERALQFTQQRIQHVLHLGLITAAEHVQVIEDVIQIVERPAHHLARVERIMRTVGRIEIGTEATE